MNTTDIEGARRVVTAFSHQILGNLVSVRGQDPNDMSEKGVRCGGTALLVETREQRFLVTAEHVIAGIDRLGLVRVIVGSRGKNIASWRIIGRDENVDIATLEVPSSFDPSALEKRFHRPERWPPPRPERGDGAIFTGFLGGQRTVSEGAITLPLATFSDFVVSSSERQFVVADEEGERIHDLETPRDVGGMSGAPVFVVRDRRFEWVGVLRAGGNTDWFFVSHADFIRPSGEIDRSKIAWASNHGTNESLTMDDAPQTGVSTK